MANTTETCLRIRPVQSADNPHIARVIRNVSAEFGLTVDRGFAVADPNLDHLFTLYSQPNSAYWVVVMDGRSLAAVV